MDVKSHIQLPKCILKQFENDNHELYYYDGNEKNHNRNIIKTGHAKTLNSELGYYSEATEFALSTKIEQPLSELLQFVNTTNFDGSQFYLDSKYKKIVLRYIYSLFSRSSQLLSAIKKESIFFQFFNQQVQHDIAVMNGIYFADEMELFKDKYLTFMVNQTDNPFIITLFDFFDYKQDDYQYIQIPLTPKISAVLVKEEWVKNTSENGVIKLLTVLDSDILFSINKLACKRELKNGRKICISNDKEYLRKIIESIKEV